MRKLLLIPLIFVLGCAKDQPLVEDPVPQLSPLAAAMSHLGMRFGDFYELTDPADSTEVLFRLLTDSTVYEFKNDYSSETTCRFWTTASQTELYITAVSGSFSVQNDPNNGLGDTVMAYYLVNRLAATDTIKFSKDNSGILHLSSGSTDLTFQKWQ